MSDPAALILLSEECSGSDSVHIRGLAAHILGLCLVYHPVSDEMRSNDASIGTISGVMGLITRAIGMDKFTSALEELEGTIEFIESSSMEESSGESPVGCKLPMFDPWFTASFSRCTHLTKRAIVDAFSRSFVADDAAAFSVSDQVTAKELFGIIESYKLLIRQQDVDLTAVKVELSELREGAPASQGDGSTVSNVQVAKELSAERLQSTTLKQQSEAMEAKWQAAEGACAELRTEKAKLDEDLQFLSITFNDLEAACFKKDEIINELRNRNGQTITDDLRAAATTDLSQTRAFVESPQDTIRGLQQQELAQQELALHDTADTVDENQATGEGGGKDRELQEGESQPLVSQMQEMAGELHARDFAAEKQQQAYALLLAEHRVLLQCLGEAGSRYIS